MPWIKVGDSTPPEGEQILVHNSRSGRMECGRYIGGRWYVEDARDGRLREVAEVTHWSWILESETYDSAED